MVVENGQLEPTPPPFGTFVGVTPFWNVAKIFVICRKTELFA